MTLQELQADRDVLQDMLSKVGPEDIEEERQILELLAVINHKMGELQEEEI